MRFRSLGDAYTEEAIRNRILGQRRPASSLARPAQPRRVRIQGSFRLCKITWKGLRALYYHYLIWKDYEELADHARYTPEYRELYQRRKETIERVFADAKEKHAMRYTQYRGLAQVSNWVKLKFAAMNLKKLAKWLCQESLDSLYILLLWPLHDPNPAYA